MKGSLDVCSAMATRSGPCTSTLGAVRRDERLPRRFRRKMPDVHYLVLTLNRSITRRAWVQDTKRLVPDLEAFNAVNGFDERSTLQALAKSRLKYHVNTYCGFSRFGTYGSLACFLTKVQALESQVQRRLPFMAMIEDDMRLKPRFRAFIEDAVRQFLAAPSGTPTDLLVLGAWGEGYVTSLVSAKRVLQSLRRQGVPLNIDIMLNAGHAGRAVPLQGTPWTHRVAPNFGDIQTTPHVRREVLIREGLAAQPRCAGAKCLAALAEVRSRYCGAGGRAGGAGRARGAANDTRVWRRTGRPL